MQPHADGGLGKSRHSGVTFKIPRLLDRSERKILLLLYSKARNYKDALDTLRPTQVYRMCRPLDAEVTRHLSFTLTKLYHKECRVSNKMGQNILLKPRELIRSSQLVKSVLYNSTLKEQGCHHKCYGCQHFNQHMN